MVKNPFFSQKMRFFRPKNIFFMKNILWGHITINIFASNGENPFFWSKMVKKVVTVVLSLNTSFGEKFVSQVI